MDQKCEIAISIEKPQHAHISYVQFMGNPLQIAGRDWPLKAEVIEYFVAV